MLHTIETKHICSLRRSYYWCMVIIHEVKLNRNANHINITMSSLPLVLELQNRIYFRNDLSSNEVRYTEFDIPFDTFRKLQKSYQFRELAHREKYFEPRNKSFQRTCRHPYLKPIGYAFSKSKNTLHKRSLNIYQYTVGICNFLTLL